MIELLKLVNEQIASTFEEGQPMLENDDIKKFFVVTKPSKMGEENMFETTILEFAKKIKSGELDEARMVGVYSKSGDAKKKANELLEEVETEMNELKSTMDEFRAKKKEMDETKSKASEIIKKYKVNEDFDRMRRAAGLFKS